ncbi:MAG: hypothetical protein ABID63_17320 [Pseudomonadota bacterium]
MTVTTRFFQTGTTGMIAAMLMLAGCGTEMRTMPDHHMQTVADIFAGRDFAAPPPTGWRQLNGSEINYRFANEVYGVYSLDNDRELMVMRLADNATARLESANTAENCVWSSSADRLNLQCDGITKYWRIYSNGPDIVGADIEASMFAVMKKRPGA